ncbi:hypothetical protein F8568_031645 [Actinomadura sp. LD22]|uniref:Uncharacterized protein n=1 Tax=Actinomadura physcomitrii TaxID=2650748 RepID=A0A6I4MRD2_9ACTN|nr:hypothetical protein [Actinomadura physcomitrii]MWA04846.1 hypothetical protein [Actinomadura physcomitrii]
MSKGSTASSPAMLSRVVRELDELGLFSRLPDPRPACGPARMHPRMDNELLPALEALEEQLKPARAT